MSSFAQIITSFERGGNFPLEANYIFPTLEDLKAFYTDEIQAATLHKGLLKIVENNGNGKQALYWVTKKATKDELEFTELVAGKDIEEIFAILDDLINKLTVEIAERKEGDAILWGADPADVPADYNSIYDLYNQLKDTQDLLSSFIEETHEKDTLQDSQLKATVGTENDNIIEFLKTLPYKDIAEISKELDRIVNGVDDNTSIIDTLTELSNFLEGYTNKDTLQAILDKLWNTIEGDPLPSKEFRTLRGIEDWLIKFKGIVEARHVKFLEELNNIETGVGLNAEGSYSADSETYYLTQATSVMNALKILDSLLHKYVTANTPAVRNNDSAVSLSITQELDSYILSALLNISTQDGNQIIKNTDGIYTHAYTEYSNGILTFLVNGNIISQHSIGVSSIVESASYDKNNEQLEFVFKLENGSTQTIYIPVHALIQEWEVENPSTSPISLTKEVIVSGNDKLSADVRLSNLPYNILVKESNTLYVKGTTDNLYHNNITLSEYLEELEAKQIEIKESLHSEITAVKVPSYTISKQGIPNTGSIVSYVLQKDNTQEGSSIDIPEQPVVVTSSFEKGVLTLTVNGEVVATHNIGLSSLVSDSYYDSAEEEIVTTFNLLDGTTQTIRTSLHNLEHWATTDTNTVILIKDKDHDGLDKISANVNLSSEENNIIEAKEDGLFVNGIASNIKTTQSTVQEDLDLRYTKEDVNKFLEERDKIIADLKQQVISLTTLVDELAKGEDSDVTSAVIINDDGVLDVSTDGVVIYKDETTGAITADTESEDSIDDLINSI